MKKKTRNKICTGFLYCLLMCSLKKAKFVNSYVGLFNYKNRQRENE